MSEVNFSVRISKERATKVAVYLAKKDKSRKALVEHVVDNLDKLRPALDGTTGRKK